MIELKTEETHARGDRGYKLLVDGVELSREQAYVYGLGRTDVSATIRGPEALTLIRRQRLSDFPTELARLSIDSSPGRKSGDLLLRPLFSRYVAEPSIAFSYPFVFRVPFWKRPWSMGELRDAIRARVENGSVAGVKWTQMRASLSIPNFTIEIPIVDQEAPIAELLDQWTPVIEGLLTDVERDLTASMRPDSLVALFDFPVDVRVACEQYLLYFVEFLKDIGVEAQADLTHDAGRVLFSVTPRDGLQALDRIREALEAYLELPASKDLGDMSSLAADPRVQQLVANLQHLKGQLYLAAAALQLKDATIAQLSMARDVVRPKTISGEVLQSSLRLIDSSASPHVDEEEIISGVVSISQYKAKGVTINLAEIYRRLRGKVLPRGTESVSDAPDESK